MKYSLAILEQDYDAIVNFLFDNAATEKAGYLICKTSLNDDECKLLVREFIPVDQAHVDDSSDRHLIIDSASFLPVMKKASNTKHSFVFLHSHPQDYPKHSPQDDKEEQKLFKTAYIRIKNGLHASLVFSAKDKVAGRVWLEDGTKVEMDVIKVIGNRFRFIFSQTAEINTDIFDRQIRAFGIDLQKMLKSMHIGIVGVGGTGSAVAEQLTRLGVGKLTIADGQKFEKSNVNRVYGSNVNDDGLEKVLITKRMSEEIGLETQIVVYDKPITNQSIINNFKNCDVIFSCTDDEWGRSLLNKLAFYYYVPVFDMAVAVDSQDEVIKSIEGRVTTIVPSGGCLVCRERIDSTSILSESLQATNPEELKERIKEGYIPELDDTAPAVIMFTTTIASAAVTELIHRLTGFMGRDRKSNEILYFFDSSRIRTNYAEPKADCVCGDKMYLGRGDTTPLLDTTWRPEI